jgi:peptidoglycan hydrolase-like protein with peptidoglycan-binding domain
MSPGSRLWRARGLLGGVAVAGTLLAAGCGGGSEQSSSTSTSPATTEPASTTTSAAAEPDQGPQGASSASAPGSPSLYFTAGEQFRKVDAGLPPGSSQLDDAVKALLSGPPKDAKAETAIPDDVSVDGVESQNGVATVSLSGNFLDGVPADPAARDDAQRQELAARLGQLTYTLTQFDGVRSVKVVAGGAPVESAVDRADYAKPSEGPQPKQRPRGAKSSSTRQIQQRLADLHYLSKKAVDGVEGYQTQEAVIAFQSWKGLERDGVVGPATTAALAHAKQPKPQSSGPSKRIEVYRAKGVALLIAHGKTKRAIHVSAGAPGTPTPPGTFQVFRKELQSWSVPFQVYLPYASYFNAGIAFHEYPDVPVYPASHGCVRVPAPEAPGVYKFAKIGTTVVVI